MGQLKRFKNSCPTDEKRPTDKTSNSKMVGVKLFGHKNIEIYFALIILL
jgi:hypothetical protein